MMTQMTRCITYIRSERHCDYCINHNHGELCEEEHVDELCEEEHGELCEEEHGMRRSTVNCVRRSTVFSIVRHIIIAVRGINLYSTVLSRILGLVWSNNQAVLPGCYTGILGYEDNWDESRYGLLTRFC